MAKSLAAQLKLQTQPKAKKKVTGDTAFVKPEMVNCNNYLPDPGDWDNNEVIYQFTDGWTINECLTRFDIRQVAFLSRTCVAEYKVRNPGLTVEEEQEFQLNEERKRAKLMYANDSWMTAERREAAVKRELARIDKEKMLLPSQRIFRLTDTEMRPRCMILTVLDDALDHEIVPINPAKPQITKYGPPIKEGWQKGHYASKRDLGLQAPFLVTGQLLHVCEARLGTGAEIPPHAVPYILEWYKASIQGKWVQKLYDTAVRARWTDYNYTNRPTRDSPEVWK